MKYRRYTITLNPKPIPIRNHDWDFAHDDYDGSPDSGDNRCGTAECEYAAKDEIDAQITMEVKR